MKGLTITKLLFGKMAVYCTFSKFRYYIEHYHHSKINTLELTLHNVLNNSGNIWNVYEILYINQNVPEKMQLNLQRLFSHFPGDKEPFLYAALANFGSRIHFNPYFNAGPRLQDHSKIFPFDVGRDEIPSVVQKLVRDTLKEQPIVIDDLAQSLIAAVKEYTEAEARSMFEESKGVLSLLRFSDKTRQKPLQYDTTHLGELSFAVTLLLEDLNPKTHSKSWLIKNRRYDEFTTINSIDLTPIREQAAKEALSYLIALLGKTQVQAIFSHCKFTQIDLSPNTPKRNAFLVAYDLVKRPEEIKSFDDTTPQAETTVSTDPDTYAVEDLLAEILGNERIENKLEAVRAIIFNTPLPPVKSFNPHNPLDATLYPYGINGQRYPFESSRMMQSERVKKALGPLLLQAFHEKNIDILNRVLSYFITLHTHGMETGVLSYFEKSRLTHFYNDCYNLAKSDVAGFLKFYKYSLTRILSDSERELLLTTDIDKVNQNIITALVECNEVDIFKTLFASFEDATAVNRLANYVFMCAIKRIAITDELSRTSTEALAKLITLSVELGACPEQRISDTDSTTLEVILKQNSLVLLKSYLDLPTRSPKLMCSPLPMLLRQYRDYNTSPYLRVINGFQNIPLQKMLLLCEHYPALIETLQQWAKKKNDVDLQAALKEKFPGMIASTSYNDMTSQLKSTQPAAAPTATTKGLPQRPVRPEAQTRTTSAAALEKFSALRVPNAPLEERQSNKPVASGSSRAPRMNQASASQ